MSYANIELIGTAKQMAFEDGTAFADGRTEVTLHLQMAVLSQTYAETSRQCKQYARTCENDSENNLTLPFVRYVSRIWPTRQRP